MGIGERQISLQERISPVTNFGPEFYLQHMGVGVEYFKGKKIADLGGGNVDLQGMLNESHVTATVFRIDLKSEREVSEGGIRVKGDMLVLPMAGESMDVVVSSKALSRWIPKDKQIDGYLEAMRVLRPGGELFVFTHRWQDGADPKKIVKDLKKYYPGSDVGFDKEKSLIHVKKKEFITETRMPEEMLVELKDKEKIEALMDYITKDVDTVGRDEIPTDNFGYNYVDKIITSLREKGNDAASAEYQKAAEFFGRCVDVGDLIGNNSRLAMARRLVGVKEMAEPDKGGWQSKDDRMLRQVLERDPERMDLLSKLRALREAMSYESWGYKNRELLERLDSSERSLAVFTLKKSILEMTDSDRRKIDNYFSELLDRRFKGEANERKLAQEKIEIFRVLGYDFQSDAVLSRFMRHHDVSVYGAAEYWGLERLSLFRTMGSIFKGKYRLESEVEWAGRKMKIDHWHNTDPVRFAMEMVNVARRPEWMFRLKRYASLVQCPTCYGYGSGFRGQMAAESVLNKGDSVASGEERDLDLKFAIQIQSVFVKMYEYGRV